MNRRWLVGGIVAVLGIAAVLALVVGGVVGRSIVPSPEPSPPDTVRFEDELTDVAIAYPASWAELGASDPSARLLAAARDASASLRVTVRRSGLEAVTPDTLPVVRPLAEDVLRADDRIEDLGPPEAVVLDGVPGYRYTYKVRDRDGKPAAHVRYFLFRDDSRLIQLIMQASPASQLAALEPTFERIARTFEDTRAN
ncbi:MAG: hypothetical protein ACR2LK_13135 [Solirubrobacteraceae bacterium]